MRRYLRQAVIVMALVIGLASVGRAQNQDGNGGNGGSQGGNNQGQLSQAPEIDPSVATAGLALLAGGLLVLRGKRR